MLKNIFKTIGTVSKRLGVDVYAVGGYVRDELMGVPQEQDVDFVVAGSGIAFAEAFAAELGDAKCRLVPFADFDTARVVLFSDTEDVPASERRAVMTIEFAGARSESYRSVSRKPAVTPATLEQDLSRRDFTVNAMARRVTATGKLGPIIDPYDGQTDVQKKLLRTPLPPDETFSDDPLRMLRAARFAAQLQFDLAPETYDAMTRNVSRLSIVSKERIGDELIRLLRARKPSIGLWALHRTGLMKAVLPEVSDLEGVEDVYGVTHKDNLSHTFTVVDNIAQLSDKPLLRFAGLLHDIGKPGTKKFSRDRGWTFDMHEHLGRKMAHQIGRRLRMSAQDTAYVAMLVRWHMQPISLMDEGVTDSAVRRLIVNMGERLADLLILCRSDITTGNPKKKTLRLKNYDRLERMIEEVREKDRLRAFQSPVRGDEIMALCGLKPGPTVGKIKTAIEEAILDGVVPNEHDAALAYLHTIKDTYCVQASDWEKTSTNAD